VLGIGEPLIGRLLTYDALGMRFREVRLRRDPSARCAGRHRPSRIWRSIETARAGVRRLGGRSWRSRGGRGDSQGRRLISRFADRRA